MRFLNFKKNLTDPNPSFPTIWTFDRNRITNDCLKKELISFIEKNKAKDDIIRRNDTIIYIWDPERNERLSETYLAYFHDNAHGVCHNIRGVIFNTFYKLYITDIRSNSSIHLSNEERILINISVEKIMEGLRENNLI